MKHIFEIFPVTVSLDAVERACHQNTANKTFISKTFQSPVVIEHTNNQKLTSKKVHFSKTFPQEATPADTIEHINEQKTTTKSNIVTGLDKGSRNDGNDVSTKASADSPKPGISQWIIEHNMI